MPRCQHTSPTPTSPTSYILFSPSSMILPGIGGGDIDAPFMTGNPICCYSHYFAIYESLMSPLTTIKEVFLTKSDKNTIRGQKHNCLGSNLLDISCTFNKTTATTSPLRPMTSKSIGMFCSPEFLQSRHQIQSESNYTHSRLAAIATMGSSSLDHWYCCIYRVNG